MGPGRQLALNPPFVRQKQVPPVLLWPEEGILIHYQVCLLLIKQSINASQEIPIDSLNS